MHDAVPVVVDHLMVHDAVMHIVAVPVVPRGAMRDRRRRRARHDVGLLGSRRRCGGHHRRRLRRRLRRRMRASGQGRHRADD